MKLQHIVRPASLCGLSATLLLVAGCASIVGGRDQMLSVHAHTAAGQEIRGAQCSMTNSKGRWEAFSATPTTIHRAYGDLTVSCTKKGHDIGSLQTASTVRNWMFGNLLFGGIIGVGVDMYTGAGFRYPDVITIVGTDVDTDVDAAPLAMPASESDGIDAPPTALPSVQRQVDSGIETMIAAHADWENLCKTNTSAPVIRVLTQTEHGSISIREGEFVPPVAASADAASKPPTCADGKIYGTRLFYSPNPGFHGADHVRYELDAANGRFTRAIDIAVQ